MRGHITKKQFLAHGWRKGDKVRGNYCNLVSVVRDVHFAALSINVVKPLDNNTTWMSYTEILEIIPAKPKKGR